MPRLTGLALLAVTCAVLALACGSSGPSTDELQAQLPQIVARAQDLAGVAARAQFDIESEGGVTGDAYGDLSEGVPAKAAAAAGKQPIAAYERTLAGDTAQEFRERPYPPVVYSTVLLFNSSGDAKSFFEEAAAAARAVGWLAASLGLEGDDVRDPQLSDAPTPLGDAVDQIVWLHASGLVGENGTLVDDILLVRDGRLWAMVRAPGYFVAVDSRDPSNAVFESGLVIPVVGRLHNAAD